MTFWEQALLGTLIVAALVNIGNWRAWLWLAAGAANYVVTSAYYDAGLPLHPAFTAFADALICIAIYNVAKEWGGHAWELPLFTAFWLSCIGGFAALLASGNASVTPSWYYAWLEACNWLALLVIVGTGTTRLADVLDRMLGHPLGWSGLHRARRAIFAPRQIDPWWFLHPVKAFTR